jgi:NAD(P)-dependent dehydrogenase (short-subunit alcohol dehydrogenase family)
MSSGCDTGIGHELARHLDGLGYHVFAGCLDTSSEGAQRLRVECSPFLRLVNMDVTKEDHVRHAMDYVAENLPAGEQGRNSEMDILVRAYTTYSDFGCHFFVT